MVSAVRAGISSTRRCCAFRQRPGKSELLAQPGFHSGHLSPVRLVIVPSQVQQAMENKDLQFVTSRVAVQLRAPAGVIGRDGDISSGVRGSVSREREDVRRFVFAAEVAVQLLQL